MGHIKNVTMPPNHSPRNATEADSGLDYLCRVLVVRRLLPVKGCTTIIQPCNVKMARGIHILAPWFVQAVLLEGAIYPVGKGQEGVSTPQRGVLTFQAVLPEPRALTFGRTLKDPENMDLVCEISTNHIDKEGTVGHFRQRTSQRDSIVPVDHSLIVPHITPKASSAADAQKPTLRVVVHEHLVNR